MSDEKLRLDQAMVARQLVATRARARDLISRGFVRVQDETITKPSARVGGDARIMLDVAAPLYVSRGAEKLTAALEAFGFSPAGRLALDVGASTGGFTQVLLAGGARKVFAVDVGHDQLDAGLRAVPEVISLEGVDARSLTPAMLDGGVDAVVVDVSFISLLKVLPSVLALTHPGAWLIALVKPQFEVGRENLGKGGIVRDAAAQQAALGRVRGWLSAQSGWWIAGDMSSPITGGSGNHEFLVGARRDG